jgi:hypothetical protein
MRVVAFTTSIMVVWWACSVEQNSHSLARFCQGCIAASPWLTDGHSADSMSGGGGAGQYRLVLAARFALSWSSRRAPTIVDAWAAPDPG